ncbi:potassium transporter [Polychaeton citri CBS 116435]|uniref:Potassium transporter n=1 Tax=Polychaeton citri CBS 116435 TaxID=1314669 RepID=A0A9P4Q9S5_9PEZI|nr:potassium transporter [Polychaeton citri CBS 116435]
MTIQFDDENVIRPVRTNESASGVHYNDAGVVFSRTATNASGVRRCSRSRSADKHRAARKLEDEDAEAQDSGINRANDYKSKQVFTGTKLLFLAYQSIGVIYGDIGTSPLYVFSSTFGEKEPSYEDLVGVLSLVIWSLTIMVTLKYVLVILHADNEGEGGTFSCYSLLSRYANITNRDPREASLVRMQRYNTDEIPTANRQIRSSIESSWFVRGLLKTIGVLAVSMVMSDGVLTPAQSVLGAVQGLEVAAPNISKSAVIGTTCGILILLFLIQPFGTTKIATAFAPIVIIWLAFNASFGIYNLTMFEYRVLKAFNPGEAFMYLARNKEQGWRSLGGVLLAFTGVEALFADLGAFSMRAIQISWLCYTYPCLILAYVGQAAYIARNEGAYSNPFFNSVPPGMLIPSLIIALLAAIVASQAIITATFQLLAQIMKLSYFPQIKVVHTSKIFHGQLYVPLVNWLLMVGTVLVAAIYNNTTSLGNAYGVCVMFVTFFDTCMVTLVALIVWRLPWYWVVLPWLTIACVDGTYLSSALTKVPDGAWFTLLLSGILAAVFILWRYGKENQWAAEAEDRFPTSHFVAQDSEGSYRLKERFGGEALSITRGFGIFFDKAGETTPIVFSQFIGKLVSTPEIMVFFHMRPLETPTVADEERYTVTKLPLPNCYRLVVRHGYMDEVVTPDLAALVFGQIQKYLFHEYEEPRAIHRTIFSSNVDEDVEKDGGDATKPGNAPSATATELVHNGHSHSNPVPVKLAQLRKAYEHRVLFILGKEEMHVKQGTSLWRKMLLNTFLFLRENTRNKMANLKVPTGKLVEIGFLKEV